MQTRYNFHFDAGHGWLEVPEADVKELGIKGDISGFSYRQGDTLYLEEDCDASRFLVAYEKREGKRFETREINDGDQSRIRRMARYEKPPTGLGGARALTANADGLSN